MTGLAELLTDCHVQDIQLRLAEDGELLIDGRKNYLTPVMIERIKAHKAEILAKLRPSCQGAVHSSALARKGRTKFGKCVCQCGSTIWNEILIHEGQSTRRDCGRCGRFIDFSIWQGKTC